MLLTTLNLANILMGCFWPASAVPGLSKAERNHEKLLTFAAVSTEVSCAVLNAMMSFFGGGGGVGWPGVARREEQLPELRSGGWLQKCWHAIPLSNTFLSIWNVTDSKSPASVLQGTWVRPQGSKQDKGIHFLLAFGAQSGFSTSV